eukprot:Clim_evm38s109 gene=Clim_evmTU38s109
MGEKNKDDQVELPIKPIAAEQLGDAEKFAYATAVVMTAPYAEHYPNHSDSKWSLEMCKQFLQHLQMSEAHQEALMTMVEMPPVTDDELKGIVSMILADSEKGYSFVVMEDFMNFCIKDAHYDSRERVMLYRMTDAMGLAPLLVGSFEDNLAAEIKAAKRETVEQKQEREKREKSKRTRKYLYTGGAAVLGGLAIGLTGGLAAPVIAGAAAATVGGSTAVFLTSAGGYVFITTLFGATGAGLSGYRMSTRIADLEEFRFEKMKGEERLSVKICVSGWLTDKMKDPARPWESLDDVGEQYALVFDPKKLLNLGEAFVNIAKKEAVGYAVSSAVAQTVIAGIAAAMAAPLLLLKLTDIIGNPWSQAMNSAKEAGEVLADVLAKRDAGHRPVTLMGYSLGAYTIFQALVKLYDDHHMPGHKPLQEGQSKKGRQDCHGIVDNIYLIGAPIPHSNVGGDWDKVRAMTAGKVTVAYCGSDWLLRFMYHVLGGNFDIAGLCPSPLEDVENVDLGDIINGHLDYVTKLPFVLKKLGLITTDTELHDISVVEDQSKLDEINETATKTVKGEVPIQSVPESEEDVDSILRNEGADFDQTHRSEELEGLQKQTQLLTVQEKEDHKGPAQSEQ